MSLYTPCYLWHERGVVLSPPSSHPTLITYVLTCLSGPCASIMLISRLHCVVHRAYLLSSSRPPPVTQCNGSLIVKFPWHDPPIHDLHWYLGTMLSS